MFFIFTLIKLAKEQRIEKKEQMRKNRERGLKVLLIGSR